MEVGVLKEDDKTLVRAVAKVKCLKEALEKIKKKYTLKKDWVVNIQEWATRETNLLKVRL